MGDDAAMNRCSNCNHPNDEGAMFCANCHHFLAWEASPSVGGDVEEESPEPEPEPEPERRR